MPEIRQPARVVVLHAAIPPGAPPDERDSLLQAEAVSEWLRELGHEVRCLALDLDLRPLADLAGSGQVAVNLVETLEADGRLAAAVAFALERFGVPFTGARGSALAATTDKLLTKRLLRAAGIPTPDWIESADERPNGGLWIVKPRFEDASIGIGPDAVREAVQVPLALARGRGALFAERYVEGREFNLSLLERSGEPHLLPLAEIDFSAFPPGRPRIVDYAAKWDPSSFAYAHTPRRFLDPRAEPELARQLREVALRCWQLFELSGYARIDLRVDGAGHPFVLEVNANPCLSADAGFLAAAAEAGLSPPEVMQALLDAAR
ncbi:D-alanine--D-alanine ligase [bacterium HR40]|nr:D-alanine--D-alanine ligase [bacterium HR40]